MLMRITRTAAMHRPEALVQIIGHFGIRRPVVLTKRMRQLRWTTDMRYEAGRRDKGETRAMLKTVAMIYSWVEEQLP